MVAPRRSSILGPDGQPVVVSDLAREKAAPETFGMRNVLWHTEATGLTPGRLAEILRMAQVSHSRPYLTLAMEMEERYLHYGAQLQTRRLALDGVSISVSAPDGVNPKAVDLVEQIVAAPDFSDVIQSLQDAIGKSYSVIEPIWEYESGALRPVVYKHRDARFFEYDVVGRENLCLLLENGLPGEPLAAPYFIRHEPKSRAGIPIRRGLARSAAWAYVMQTFALQDWSAFCEIYGIPFRLGRYHTSASDQDKMTLLRAVRNISNDAAAIVPEGMEIEFHETNGNRGEAVFGNFIDYLDRKVSLAILGQTMTADVSQQGGSLAQAQVHENVRADILRADARQTAGTLNRDLIRPLVAMNFGPQEVYPHVAMDLAENEDLDALGGFLDKTVKLGLKVSQKYVRDRAGIPEPEPDDVLLTPEGASAPDAADAPDAQTGDLSASADKTRQKVQLSAVGCCPNCGAQPSARFAVDDPTAALEESQALADTDALVEAALANDGWREIRDPLLAGLLAAVGQATSFEDLLKRLDTAKIDSAPLIEKLALATTKARLSGGSAD
jgi:phage gp29-like protein